VRVQEYTGIRDAFGHLRQIHATYILPSPVPRNEAARWLPNGKVLLDLVQERRIRITLAAPRLLV
jgi:hypothetical protein